MASVKFYFYKLEYKLSRAFFDWSMSDYFSNNLILGDHLKEIGENKAFLDKKAENIFSFQKFKKDFKPIIKDEVTGDTKTIELKPTEYLLEEAFIYWDFGNNIIIFQHNHSGFGERAFEKYILTLLGNKFDNNHFALKQILSKDGVEKLVNNNIVKRIDISVAIPSISVLKELGFDIHKIKDIDKDGIDRVEIRIIGKKKKGIFSVENLKGLIDFKNKNTIYKNLKLKASNSYLSSGEEIDLLDDCYIITRKIKEIAASDMIYELNDVYQNNINEVLKLV